MFCRRWTLIVKFLVLRICLVVRSGDIPVVTNISEDTTWVPEDTYLLNQQIQVLPNVTLTILPGVMVKAGNLQGSSAALIISQGARILAEGTADKPITFTTQFSTVNTKRGLWGGLVICGYGILAKGPGTSRFLEGFENIIYGGSDEEDYSGILKYVRIWHGGGDLSGDQHINGLTLAGVGSKTIIEHVEVAWSDDDGFEFFGGSVNAKWISSIFNADDAIDTDDGYSGRMQFVFSIVDKDGDHAMELDSNSFDGETNTQPRAFPQIYGATIIRTEKAANDDPLITFRTGTGGRFGNMILRGGQDDSMNALVANPGFSNTNFCGNQSRFSNLSDTLATQLGLDYLFFSQNNIIYTPNLQATETGDYPFDISCSSTDSWTPLATIVDPLFVLLPKSWDAYTIDPRPREESPAYIDLDKLPHGDDFFTQTTYKGAFGDDLWIAGWSYLTSAGLLPDKSVTSVGKTILEGNITSDTTLDDDSRQYYLIGPLYVKSGATLTIPSGTTIRASRQSSEGKTPCVIIENGAQLVAIGDEASPITFTTVLSAIDLSTPGLWGGIAILGKAISSIRHSSRLLPGGSVGNFGNFDDNDKSGTLRYVRVWYAGSTKLDNTEGDGFGVMLGGVGNKTIVEYVEVAFSGKDGFVFDGGSVNARYLSVVSQNEDAFDISNGYVGKLQFIAALLDENGEKAANIKSNGTLQRRTSPQISGATFMKSKHRSSSTELMRVSKGAGGEYTNIILTGFSGVCLSQIECADESRNTGPNLPSEGVVGTYYWSSKNIVNCIGPTTLQVNQFELDSSCSAQNFSPESRFGDGAQLLQLLPIDNIEWFSLDTVFQLDPRPAVASEALKQYDTLLDPFFDAVTFVGAFGTNLWLHQWSILSTRAYIPDRDVQLNENNTLSSTISTDTTLSGSRIWYLTTQVFVLSGATLTIPAGTTIRAYRQESDGKAPSLIIKQGAKIIASGTSLSPITFTSVLPSFVLPRRGTWGGIILLGNAIITGNQTMKIEGLSSGDVYGGLDDSDDSGTLRYVRVWYGGADIGFDPDNPESSGNEINGITFGGVGSGTTVEYVEVAFNKDDGFEFFGGSVNGRYLSALFCDDDAFDTDQGYQGKLQYIFAMVDNKGDHAAEMDSDEDDIGRRSFPMVSGATFIKSRHLEGQENGLLQIREGGGGEFYNVILTGFSGAGLENNECLSESHTSSLSSRGSIPNYLFWSEDNIVNTISLQKAVNGVSQFKIASSCAYPIGEPKSRSLDPNLILVPEYSSYSEVLFIDPRPIWNGNALRSPDHDAPTDTYFQNSPHMGAFSGDMWLEGLSYLSDNNLIPSGAIDANTLLVPREISSDLTLTNANTYLLTQRATVVSGVTLTIEPGTTIYAYKSSTDGHAPALIVQQGAILIANGTADSPITFTSVLPSPTSGVWGGIVILGNGIITGKISRIFSQIGLNATYGGNDDTDASGVIRYLRVWYAGKDSMAAITFAGVGNGTIVDKVETAFSGSDGFAFLGGAVNAKHLSAISCISSAYNISEGYQGKLQFLFGFVENDGYSGASFSSEMDSERRTFPIMSGVTILRGNKTNSDVSSGLIKVSGGAGGEFYNIILVANSGSGLEHRDCHSEDHSSSMKGTAPNYLFWSSENIMLIKDNATFGISNGCTWTIDQPITIEMDPQLVLLLHSWTGLDDILQLDPRPLPGGRAFKSNQSLEFTSDNPFFETTTYSGAFGADLWIAGWSYLSGIGLLPAEDVNIQEGNFLFGSITENHVLGEDIDTYYLLGNLFVKAGANLTILPNTTIKSYLTDKFGISPMLVIEQGAKIFAIGDVNSPITFTSILPLSSLPARGTWGGIVLLGKSSVSEAINSSLEGLASYGGSNDNDNSGVLRYVRVWFAGANLDRSQTSSDTGGLTLAGVGSETTINFVEIAFAEHDGLKLLGGTVNLRYVSSLFPGHDGFDIDKGYSGRIQFLFGLVDKDGQSALKVDGGGGLKPRTFPRVWGATFIKGDHTIGVNDALVTLRNRVGGEFVNMVLAGKAGKGFSIRSCEENFFQTTKLSEVQGASDYLLWSEKNIVSTVDPVTGDTDGQLDAPQSEPDICFFNPNLFSRDIDPEFLQLNSFWATIDDLAPVDPRPSPGIGADDNVFENPIDTFFIQVDYVGAFSSENLWLRDWSYLSEADAFEISTSSPTTISPMTPAPSASPITVSPTRSPFSEGLEDILVQVIHNSQSCSEDIIADVQSAFEAVLSDDEIVQTVCIPGSAIFNVLIRFNPDPAAQDRGLEFLSLLDEAEVDPGVILRFTNGFNEAVWGPISSLSIISVNIAPSTGADNPSAIDESIVAGVVVIVLIVVGIAAILWFRRKRIFQSKDGIPMEELQAIDFEQKSNVSLPDSIDVFSKLTQQPTQNWLEEFQSFNFKLLSTKDILPILIKHGREWQVRLFEFLRYKLAMEEDFQVMIHNSPMSFKQAFLARAVSTLAEITVDMFILKYKESKKLKLRDSLDCIRKACNFGSEDQEESIKALFLFAVVNKIYCSLFRGSRVSAYLNVDFSHLQWRNIIELCEAILRNVCRRDRRYLFSLPTVNDTFQSGKLVSSISKLMQSRVLRDMLSENGVREMLTASTVYGSKNEIQVNSVILGTYMRVFIGLEIFFKNVRIEIDDKYRKKKNAAFIEKTEVKHSIPNMFRGLNSKHHKSFYHLVDALNATKMFKGEKKLIELSLIYSIKKVESSKVAGMGDLQQIADRALVGEVSKKHKELRTLPPPQVEELAKQLVAHNRVDKIHFKAYMSGIRVSIRVLQAQTIKGPVKQALLRHQELSNSPFILQLFGMGFSKTHGWFLALEYVEKSLTELLKAWPPLSLTDRIQLGLNLTSAIEHLHTSRVYHGDITPDNLLVTSSLQVKITEFLLSGRLADTTFQTMYSAGSSINPYYRSPEQHSNTNRGDEKFTAGQARKMDVFSTGAILSELLSSVSARLYKVLPHERELPSYYQSLQSKLPRSSFAPILTIKEESSVSSRKRFRVSISGVVPAFDLKQFRIPEIIEPIILSTISLIPIQRPTIFQLRKELKILIRQERKKLNEQKSSIIYLEKEAIQEIERNLTYINRIKGTSHIYKLTLSGLDVVIKILGVSGSKSTKWVQEVELHQQVANENPYVVRVIGCGHSEVHGWFLCMHYIPNTLQDVIFSPAPPTSSIFIRMAIDMARGFEMLHEANVFHRDIKPLNVLVTSDFHIRITDFGISSKMETSEDGTRDAKIKVTNVGVLGTKFYMAPEQHIRGPSMSQPSVLASQMIDVYAFGVLLIEMFSRKKISEMVPTNIRQEYLDFRGADAEPSIIVPEDSSKAMPQGILEVVNSCIAFNPAHRPTMANVRSMLEAVGAHHKVSNFTNENCGAMMSSPSLPSLSPRPTLKLATTHPSRNDHVRAFSDSVLARNTSRRRSRTATSAAIKELVEPSPVSVSGGIGWDDVVEPQVSSTARLLVLSKDERGDMTPAASPANSNNVVENENPTMHHQ